MDKFLQKLLDYYHLTYDEYLKLNKDINDIRLLDVNTIIDIDTIRNRIQSAIVNKEQILIYGDYDCDGICSTSIVKRTFDILNYPIKYYIPSRYLDGYGLNVENVHKIAKAGYKLIITVDNGISANEAIDLANSYGIDVIVVDHHEVPEVLPNAYGFIHPTVSKISNIFGSGGYMSLFLSCALLNKYDDYLVTLAGLSVISDLMELKDYNRDVVLLALSNFDKNRYLPLRLLTDTNIVTEKTFSLEIAPKINAIGRICEKNEANRLIKYLTSSNELEIIEYSKWILSVNEERKLLTKTFSDSFDTSLLGNSSSIVTICDTKEGIIGLIANRFLNMFNVPSIAFAVDSKDENILKGSARSKAGFSIVEAYKDESISKYLITSGGHAYAGGLSIKKEDFEAFKQSFDQYASLHPFIDDEKPTIEISLSDINKTNYKTLRTFAPFGMGFEEPLFLIKHFKTSELDFISYGKHISTRLGISTKLLGFNMPYNEVSQYKFIDLKGNFHLSYYNGIEYLEFRLNSYEKSTD